MHQQKDQDGNVLLPFCAIYCILFLVWDVDCVCFGLSDDISILLHSVSEVRKLSSRLHISNDKPIMQQGHRLMPVNWGQRVVFSAVDTADILVPVWLPGLWTILIWKALPLQITILPEKVLVIPVVILYNNVFVMATWNKTCRVYVSGK